MPYQAMPTFGETKLNMLEIPQPGIGGLNLHDLEYEQEVNQSPNMLNMMYRNGTFSKRYGMEIGGSYEDEIYAVCSFNGKLIVHSGSHIYVDGEEAVSTLEQEGTFVSFGESLYYFNQETLEYKYDDGEWLWEVMEPYIPEAFTECKPAKDGTYNRGDDFNLLTLKYKCVYDGDGTSQDYYPRGNEDDIINWDITPTVYISEVKTTAFTVDATNKKITFTTAPASGTDNVEITFTTKESTLEKAREQLNGCKYFCSYGANGSSHLFAAGGGGAKVFYSDSYDASYFPENNWIVLGSMEDDITGFGLQYNVLIVFKPKEIYSLYSYNVTASMVTSDEEEEIGTEAFGSQLVNSQMGCDAPHTIQLINNNLTWFNSNEGICTLVSTNVADERNVRMISRNINRTNNFDVEGILDIDEDLENIKSVDFDYKYFIVFPTSGKCFCWDYSISPFTYTSSKVTDPKTLDWFLFDKFYVKDFVRIGDYLYFSSEKANTKLIKLGDKLSDIDFTNTSDTVAINSYYMTPLNQYSAVEYLKTIKNIYVQCRGDKPSTINMKYITEDNPNGEDESEPIKIYSNIFDGFTWENFGWEVLNFVNTFRRKCSIKKVQVLAVKFYNNELNSDMSISHLAMQYQVVKTIK